MAAAIDFKNPSFVVVGHWNAAILNEAGWIAKNILEIPEGQQIDLNAVIVGNQVIPGQVKDVADRHRARDAIVKGALQFAASEMLDQNTFRSKGDEEIYEGVRMYEAWRKQWM